MKIDGHIQIWDVGNQEFKWTQTRLDGYEIISLLDDDAAEIRTQLSKGKYFVKAQESEFLKLTQIENYLGEPVFIFLCNRHQVEEIKGYYEDLNLTFIEEQRQFKTKVLECATDLETSIELSELTKRLILNVEHVILTDISQFIGFESLLYNLGQEGEFLLSSSYYQLTQLPKGINFEAVKSYYQDVYLKFIEIVKTKMGQYEFQELIYATWVNMRNVAAVVYSNQFEQLYGKRFNNLNNLDEIIERYCESDHFDIRSARNAMLLTYHLMESEILGNEVNFIECYVQITEKLFATIKRLELSDFEKQISKDPSPNKISIDDVDMMTGLQFEDFISVLFQKLGYAVTQTKASGDQGIDIIIEKNGLRMGVQTKCYAKNVNNSAVQEVVAGLRHYNLSKGIVVTNNYFTQSAQELAESNQIVLWDRDMLKLKLTEIY